MSQEPKRSKRRYHSPIRTEKARATRKRIRTAAEELFVRDGYASTSMSRVAAGAGVAEKTVYLAFPTKVEMLAEIIRVAVRGDDEQARVVERRSWREMLESPDSEIFKRFAEWNEGVFHRAGRILAVGEAAALSDPELAARRDRGHAAQRGTCREFARELQSRGILVPELDVKAATDILFAILSQDVYLRLVDERRWSRRRYAEWLEWTLRRTLIRSDPALGE
jgi:AcrR family transcriptional regulator